MTLAAPVRELRRPEEASPRRVPGVRVRLVGDTLCLRVPVAMAPVAILEAIVQGRAALLAAPRGAGPGRPPGRGLTVTEIRAAVERLAAAGVMPTQHDVAAELFVGTRTIREILAHEGTSWRREFPATLSASFRVDGLVRSGA